MLSQWFQPEPFFKGIPFAKELKELGHDIEVLTGIPNYPSGKIYPGYSNRSQRDTIDGISIIRVPIYCSHDANSIRRILNYTSFALSSLLIGLWKVKRPDVIYVYHPPVTIGLPAIIAKMIFRVPIVYDIQDLWPDSVKASNMLNSSLIISLINYWCNIVYCFSDRLVVLSPGFKSILVDRGVPAKKIKVIYNWCDEKSLLSCAKQDFNLAAEIGFSDRFNFVFAGNIGKGQALETVLEAAKILEIKCPHMQMVFVGDGIEVDRLKTLAIEIQCNNVVFLGRKPMDEIGEILRLADVLLVHLKKDPLYQVTIPSKTQAYMAIGRPILMAVQGDASDLVFTARAGLTCIPESAVELATAMDKMYQMPHEELEIMGRNGQEYYERELSLKSGVDKFAEVFSDVVRRYNE